MKYSGVYLIPIHGATQDASAHIFAALINGIESHFEFASRQSPWSLFHRLLRSVPIPNAPADTPSYQHIFHASYLGNASTYCYIHPSTPSSQTSIKLDASLQASVKGEPISQAPTPQPSHSTPITPATYGTIITIPLSQSESHLSYHVNQLSPMWTHRHSLNIPHGITYSAGQYTLHIGEIRMSRSGPSASSNLISPGVVVCITALSGVKSGDGNGNKDEGGDDSGYVSIDGSGADDEVVDFEEAQAEVRAVWTSIKSGIDFGKAEAREVMMGREGVEEHAEKEAIVRMWCDALRLKG